MEEIKRKLLDEEAKASLDIWRYVFGFADIAAAKCAIDLKIPEAIENHPSSQPVTLAELSSAVSASPSHLRRIMRFLVHQGLFKEVPTKDGLATGYTNTSLSRRMMITKRDGKSLAPFVLFETRPEMLAPWLRLSSVVSSPVNGSTPPPFDAVHGKDVWSFAQDNPGLSELINEAMACDTRRVVPRVAGACHGLFDGVDTVVDVGGGTGETLGILVKEFPWIKGFNFDLPHVIEVAQVLDGVENVEGDMFDSIPACDAVFIKWVLHDWGDKDCIKILKNCKEAVPPNVGKVLIVESVIGENKKTMIVEERDEKLEHVRLMLDMVMMAHTSTGKERTLKEWDFVLTEAGFARYEWLLHDWGDKDCIKILKNCKEAVLPNVGKVLIVECVIGEKKNTMIVEERDEMLEHVRLQLDMVMMVHTSTGKERTLKEWDFVLTEAGFARYEVRDIDDVQSLIITYRS